jgi:hypothetical protein
MQQQRAERAPAASMRLHLARSAGRKRRLCPSAITTPGLLAGRDGGGGAGAIQSVKGFSTEDMLAGLRGLRSPAPRAGLCGVARTTACTAGIGEHGGVARRAGGGFVRGGVGARLLGRAGAAGDEADWPRRACPARCPPAPGPSGPCRRWRRPALACPLPISAGARHAGSPSSSRSASGAAGATPQAKTPRNSRHGHQGRPLRSPKASPAAPSASAPSAGQARVIRPQRLRMRPRSAGVGGALRSGSAR